MNLEHPLEYFDQSEIDSLLNQHDNYDYQWCRIGRGSDQKWCVYYKGWCIQMWYSVDAALQKYDSLYQAADAVAKFWNDVQDGLVPRLYKNGSPIESQLTQR